MCVNYHSIDHVKAVSLHISTNTTKKQYYNNNYIYNSKYREIVLNEEYKISIAGM